MSISDLLRAARFLVHNLLQFNKKSVVIDLFVTDTRIKYIFLLYYCNLLLQ